MKPQLLQMQGRDVHPLCLVELRCICKKRLNQTSPSSPAAVPTPLAPSTKSPIAPMLLASASSSIILLAPRRQRHQHHHAVPSRPSATPLTSPRCALDATDGGRSAARILKRVFVLGPCRQPASLRSAAPINVRYWCLSKRDVIKKQFHLLASDNTINSLVLKGIIINTKPFSFFTN